MKYFKTFESIFDDLQQTAVPTLLIQELKSISDEYYDVLLSWVENSIKLSKSSLSAGEIYLEKIYKHSNELKTSLDNRLSTIVADFIIVFPMMEKWIKDNKISKSTLKARKYSDNFIMYKQWQHKITGNGKILMLPDEIVKKNVLTNNIEISNIKNISNLKWTRFNNFSGSLIRNEYFNMLVDSIQNMDNFVTATEDISIYYLYDSIAYESVAVIIINSYTDLYNISTNKQILTNKNWDIIENLILNKIKILRNTDKVEDIYIPENFNNMQSKYNLEIHNIIKLFNGFNIKSINYYVFLYKNDEISYTSYMNQMLHHFNDVKQFNNTLYLETNDYSDDIFITNFELNSREIVSDILNGDGYKYFNYDIESGIWSNYWYMTNDYNVKEILQYLNQTYDANLKNKDDVEQYLNTLDSTDETIIILNQAAIESKEIADIDEVYKDVLKTINEQFNIVKFNNKLLIPVDKWINLLYEDDYYTFKDFTNIESWIDEYISENNENLQLNEPQYGYMGDVSNELWNEVLNNKWSEEF